MFCKYCGKEVSDEAQFCPHCGRALSDGAENAAQDEGGQAAAGERQNYANNQAPNGAQGYNAPPSYPQAYQNPADARSGGFAALGFFFPLVGLILFLVWKDTMPLRSKSCGKGALIGVIVWFVVGIVFGIIAGIIGASLGMQYYGAAALFSLF